MSIYVYLYIYIYIYIYIIYIYIYIVDSLRLATPPNEAAFLGAVDEVLNICLYKHIPIYTNLYIYIVIYMDI